MRTKLLFCAALFGLMLSTLLAQETKKPTPAEGYNIHVVAPHVVDGKIMGPYHHYCKVMAPDPQIVCLIFDSTEPNAMLQQVEFIWAKSLVRSKVSRATWNKYWHDHKGEIATGRVQVLDMPADEAKKVADLVATTDGYIIHLTFENGMPAAGKISFPQAVGHVPLSAKEYKESAAEQTKEPAHKN